MEITSGAGPIERLAATDARKSPARHAGLRGAMRAWRAGHDVGVREEPFDPAEVPLGVPDEGRAFVVKGMTAVAELMGAEGFPVHVSPVTHGPE